MPIDGFLELQLATQRALRENPGMSAQEQAIVRRMGTTTNAAERDAYMGTLSGMGGAGAASSGGSSGSGGSGLAAGFEGADPFASQRAGYQEMLKTGMTSGDPYGGWGTKMQSMMNGQFDATDPSYKWRYEQGLQATQRAGAAKGMGGSGNEMLALQEAGQGMASQEYGNQFNRLYSLMGQSAGQFNATMDRLANLSGAQFSPATPYQLGVQKYGIDVGAATQRYGIDAQSQTSANSLAQQNSQWQDQQNRLNNQDAGIGAGINGYRPGDSTQSLFGDTSNLALQGSNGYQGGIAPIDQMGGASYNYSPSSSQGYGYVSSSSGSTQFNGNTSTYTASPFVTPEY